MGNETKLAQPMQLALRLANQAFDAGEVPVGAVIVDAGGNIISSAHNQMRANSDATAHAEMLAIRSAMQVLGQMRLEGCDLWVTLEPCAMCAGAIAHARLRRIYFGASDPKGGAVDNGPCLFSCSTINHRPEIYGGIGAADSAKLLQRFFENRR